MLEAPGVGNRAGSTASEYIVGSVDRRRVSLAVDLPFGLWSESGYPSDEGSIVEIGMRESLGELAAHRGKGLLSNEVHLV